MNYQIHDIEQMTGIKAHTVRIWEKRYNLLSPHRTATNIRYYDDEQVRRLLNVSTLVNAGKKISRVARMTDTDLAMHIRELQLNGPAQHAYASFMAALTTSMLNFNEEEFGSLIDQIFLRYGSLDAVTKVVYPFLTKVGVLWSTNEAMPAQEHFASCLIRKKLILEAGKLPAAWRADKKVMLFLPPEEWHEIGLLLSEFVVKSCGYKTIYLGQSVPFENVLRTFKSTQVTHLISFYILPKKKVNLPAGFAQLADNIDEAILTVCGSSAMLQQLSQGPKLRHCSSVDDLLVYLEK